MLKPLLRRLRDVVRGPTPSAILAPASRIFGLERTSYSPTSRLYVRASADGALGHMMLGPGVYIGRNVELATSMGGDLLVGEDTSIQDNCVFHGDIAIGAHCLFGANAMMSTTIHRFRDQPHRLIRDQDEAVAASAQRPADYSRPIIIEDDCWLGWGMAIMPGVYVGRGAIVGANCVLTRDVGPYEIHGGVPNRLLGKRLDFSPLRAISSENDADIPYFYRGFRLRQQQLLQSREGVRAGTARAALVLAGGARSVRIEGVVLDAVRPLRLGLHINGVPIGEYELNAGPFRVEPEVEAVQAVRKVPESLASYTFVELFDLDNIAVPVLHRSANRYAIRSAQLT